MGILDAFFGRMFNSGTELTLTSGVNYTGGIRGVLNQSTKLTDVSIDPATVSPTMLAVLTSSMGVPFVIAVDFAAATTGTADDVEILSSSPFALRILDRWVDITITGVGVTGQFRSASGGVGTGLSGAFDASSTCNGRRASSGSIAGTAAVAAGGAIHFRRSDRAIAGTAYLLVART